MWADADFRTKPTSERAQILHNSDKDLSDLVWRNGAVAIPRLQGLKVLTLDIEQCFCPMGCCRMRDQVINALNGLKSKKGVKLIITGCIVPGEEQAVRKALKCELDTKPTKPERDSVRDAQHIRDVFEGLYSSGESDLEDDSLEDEDDSDMDDEEDGTDDEDDSEEDGEDSDGDGDEDGSSDSETSGDGDDNVPVAKADVEILETSSGVTDAGPQSETATETVDVNRNDGPGSSSTAKSATSAPYDKATLLTTTSKGDATDKTDTLRVLSSEDARRLMVTVNPTSAAYVERVRKAADKAFLDSIKSVVPTTQSRVVPLNSLRSAGPTIPSPVVPSIWSQRVKDWPTPVSIWPQPIWGDNANVSSNRDANTDDLVDLDNQGKLDKDVLGKQSRS